jgi:hypothetical protein
MHKKTSNKKQGSILVYCVIILAMMLVIASGMSFVTITEKKDATTTEASAQAIQTADSGMELGLKIINNNLTNSLSSAFGSNCSGGTVSGTIGNGSAQSSYQLTFQNSSGTVNNCSELGQNIINIQSIGTYKNTVRSVSTAVSSNNSSVTALQGVNTLLLAYHAAHGSYPVSSGWQGYCSSYGASLGVNWIPELGVALPIDPRDNGSCWDSPGVGQYIYNSNGTDYKLLSHVPQSMNVPANLIDPARPTWAWGWWSSGGAGF